MLKPCSFNSSLSARVYEENVVATAMPLFRVFDPRVVTINNQSPPLKPPSNGSSVDEVCIHDDNTYDYIDTIRVWAGVMSSQMNKAPVSSPFVTIEDGEREWT